MKKLSLILCVMSLIFVLNGCVMLSKEELANFGQRNSGISSANEQEVTFCGSGYAALSDLDSTKNAALYETKKQLISIIQEVFDSTEQKFRDEYPDKRISDDTLAALEGKAVKKAAKKAKIIYYDKYLNMIGIIAMSKVNVSDLGLPPEMADIFVSTAKGLFNPDADLVKIKEQYEKTGIIVPFGHDGLTPDMNLGSSRATVSASVSSAGGSDASAESGEEPFWAHKLVGQTWGNDENGIISIKNNEIIVYGIARSINGGLITGRKENSAELAMKQTGQCIDSIIDKTINEYLQSNPDEQSACDAVKTASKDISSDAVNNSRISGKWIKEIQLMFNKTQRTYYALATYKFDFDSLKMPAKMKSIFISTAKDMISPFSRKYEALMKGKKQEESQASGTLESTDTSDNSHPSNQKVKIIMNDNTILNGTLAGQNDTQIFLQLKGDKAKIIKKSDIKAAFDAVSGEAINF